MQIKAQTKNSITLLAPGKINLTLEVLSKRPDNFHNLATILTEIPLFDEVIITLKPANAKTPKITLDDPALKVLTIKHKGRKAAQLIFKNYARKIKNQKDVHIKIKRKIPLGGGLGGSSSSSVAIILGLLKLLKIKEKNQKLIQLANQIGSDTPFFIKGGLALAQGKGEKLTQISTKSLQLPLLLVLSPKESPVDQCFKKLNLNPKRAKNSLALKKVLEKNSQLSSQLLAAINKYAVNDLEKSSAIDPKRLQKIKALLLKNGASIALMSGSGSTIYGIYPNNYTLNKAKRTLKKNLLLISLPCSS